MASTVLITGASQGIGQVTARKFAQHGYNLVLAARHADRLKAVAEELQGLGTSVLAVPTDVRDAQQVHELVRAALERYGTVDVLINNAGIYCCGPVEQFSLEEWHQVIDTNLWGYIHTIQALLPQFLAQGKGTIVNVGSIGGKVPIPYLLPYTTSKFAITGLTEALHSELSPKGIQVCGIYPNLIRSDFLERAIFEGETTEDAQARRQQHEQLVQIPVVEKPEDVADAIWQAVQHRKSEVLVGSANLAAIANGLLPGVTQWAMRKAFQQRT